MNIFIIEDDRFYSEIIKYHLELNPDYTIEVFTDGKSALKALKDRPDMVCLDFSLPDIDGVDLLKRIKQISPQTEVVIVSGQEDVSTAISLLKEGAYDYIVKDDDTRDRIWKAAININNQRELKEEVIDLRKQLKEKKDYKKKIFGKSKAMEKVFTLMEKAAKSSITVSITGETGTGKELVAKGIHDYSERSSKNFVAVNMAAIPKELMESELFGYEKGAFTGAANKRIGKFEEAHLGTIFLDEIGDLDLSLQAKLLRVLQEQEVTRIGSNKPIKLNSRVIIATHQNLQKKVEDGTFRQDLFYRVYGLPISLPPLRERGNDALLMTQKFINEFCKENKMDVVKISPEACQAIQDYTYPGNVRELKAIVELACVLADEIILNEHLKFITASNMKHLLNQERSLKVYNKLIIQHFLEKYDNNVLQVAEILDVGKSTLYRMINAGDLNH